MNEQTNFLVLQQFGSDTTLANIQQCESDHECPTHTQVHMQMPLCGICTLHLTHTDAGLYGFLKARKQGSAQKR